MSTAQVLLTATFVAVFAVLVLLRLADMRERQRSLRNLPPNTADGTPAITARRERWLAALLCVFVLAVLSWLVAGG